MAYLAKKCGRFYIRDYRKEPKLNASGLPVKDSKGNVVYKTVNVWIKSSKDERLAKIELGKYEENKDRGRIGLERRNTAWQDIRDRYMAYSRANKAQTSVNLDETVFTQLEVFYPQISQVSDLTISLCEKFFEWLKTNRNKPATIKRKGTTLKNIGSKLVDWEIMQYNPLQRLKIPKVTHEKEIQYWKTPEDIKKVVDRSTGIWKTINMVGFCIGARISEILSLSRGSFDFKTGTYKIQSHGNFRTKSRKFRIGKIPPPLMEYLPKLFKEYDKNPKIKSDRIIVYADGSLPEMDSCSAFLRDFYKRIGYPGYHPHCLRHTFAAHYLFKYKDIYGLSQLLGHSSVLITQKYYGHLLGNYFDSSMAKFDPFENMI